MGRSRRSITTSSLVGPLAVADPPPLLTSTHHVQAHARLSPPTNFPVDTLPFARAKGRTEGMSGAARGDAPGGGVPSSAGKPMARTGTRAAGGTPPEKTASKTAPEMARTDSKTDKPLSTVESVLLSVRSVVFGGLAGAVVRFRGGPRGSRHD